MKKIAISMGDVNGVGIEIALLAHDKVKQLCAPLYCINPALLTRVADKLGVRVPEDFNTVEVGEDFPLHVGHVDAKSGMFSYESFLKAVHLTQEGDTEALVTLPINKEAWDKAGIAHRGHTEAFASIYPNSEPIMMLGSPELYVSLFTHHIPLREVPAQIDATKLEAFMLALQSQTGEQKIGVLGLNPHAGDGGVLGNEEVEIEKAIFQANKMLGKEVFYGPLVPDTAFLDTRFRHFMCMYHDQGLIVLKRLYFDSSINATLNIPIIRTSVDHGTAYDIAYQNKHPKTQSYLNAIKTALELAQRNAK